MQKSSFLVVFVLACSTSAPVDEAALEAARGIVGEHVTATESARSLEEMDGLEADYHHDWTALRHGMGGSTEGSEDCPMAEGGGMGGMGAGDMAPCDCGMARMDHAMAAHGEGHAEHGAMGDCMADEAGHAEMMMETLDEMAEGGCPGDMGSGHMGSGHMGSGGMGSGGL